MIFWGINLCFSMLLFCFIYLFIFFLFSSSLAGHFEITEHFFTEKFDQAFILKSKTFLTFLFVFQRCK